MKIASRVLLGFWAFLLVDGLIYLFTAHEYVGGPLILATSVAFLYLGLITRGAARRAERASPSEKPPVEEAPLDPEHVGPTIWPFGFSLAAVLLAAGAVGRHGLHWLLVPGLLMFVASGGGWVLDIRRQHADASAHAGPHSGGDAAPVEPGRRE